MRVPGSAIGEREVAHICLPWLERTVVSSFSSRYRLWVFEIEISRSPPINIEDIGSVHFRLRRLGESQRQDLVRADVRIEGSTIFIFLTLANEDWPFVIENGSDYPMGFCQQVNICRVSFCRIELTKSGCWS